MMDGEFEIRRATSPDANGLVSLCHDAYSGNIRLGFPASAAPVSLAEVERWITEEDHLYVGLR